MYYLSVTGTLSRNFILSHRDFFTEENTIEILELNKIHKHLQSELQVLRGHLQWYDYFFMYLRFS